LHTVITTSAAGAGHDIDRDVAAGVLDGDRDVEVEGDHVW
jgi:hypothetical protein